jgi:spore coat protein A
LKISASIVFLLIASFSVAFVAQIGSSLSYPPTPTLDPTTIPKYVSELVIPPVYDLQQMWDPVAGAVVQEATVDMTEFYQQILPAGYPMTLVWGYGGQVKDAITGQSLGYVRNSPGPSFIATRNLPIKVNWVNHVTRYFFPVDPTLHWADPNELGMVTPASVSEFPPGELEAQTPVPLVTHLHGGEVHSSDDGHPEAWWTANGLQGPEYNTFQPSSLDTAVFYYPNEQPAATLWYHDHGLGVTRINVMSGLAGFYLLEETGGPLTGKLPSGEYDVPIVIQDRSFNDDGSMWFPTEGNSPDDHPYWEPEFFGEVMMVNGKTWPNFNVDQGQYRLRLLDGSNARFYTFQFRIVDVPGNQTHAPVYGDPVLFTVIGSDGGLLPSAVPDITELTIGPGERIEILIDFSTLDTGEKIIMTNSAIAPYKGPYVDVPADAPDPLTSGQIMQFTVEGNKGYKAKTLPATLNPTLAGEYPTLGEPDYDRTLPFFEAMNQTLDEPIGVFLNGQKWDGVITEDPQVGSTEDWYLVNPTEDVHPIHTHLTQFQILYRQPINVTAYLDDWYDANGITEADIPLPIGTTPVEVPYNASLYADGPVEMPMDYEKGWKDTIHAWPGYVTVIRIRWAPIASPTDGPGAPTPGVNLYPFDPTTGPGYVWHCHILDHEDNEMMRPYEVYNTPQHN